MAEAEDAPPPDPPGFAADDVSPGFAPLAEAPAGAVAGATAGPEAEPAGFWGEPDDEAGEEADFDAGEALADAGAADFAPEAGDDDALVPAPAGFASPGFASDCLVSDGLVSACLPCADFVSLGVPGAAVSGP
ncbi:hypothetical protein [Stappia stellulata]|uniref:hypothetical protein n=1 Tax=Stappia stellulata TaxID=71235 RepID=UPI0004014764|nr:hypothetical protein [Stappia stellulata]